MRTSFERRHSGIAAMVYLSLAQMSEIIRLDEYGARQESRTDMFRAAECYEEAAKLIRDNMKQIISVACPNPPFPEAHSEMEEQLESLAKCYESHAIEIRKNKK
ncbi:MAG: hypothetical protein WC796_02800 [Candidatus Pacearchaeota archaeon]|jgi:hypothetical protein